MCAALIAPTGRRRGDGRRVVRLSRLAGHVDQVGGEEDNEAISSARRAAELIQFYWPRVYERYVRKLAVTPTSMYAVTYLFYELADGRLLDLYPHWEDRVDTHQPFRNFRRRLARTQPGALQNIWHSRPNLWEPEPLVYGVDLEWVIGQMPSKHFGLFALMWKLWRHNPIYSSLLGLVDDDAAQLVAVEEAPELAAAIQAVPPLPAFSGREAVNAFWARLGEVPLGTSELHPVSLGAALAYPLFMTDNEYANTSVDELHESYDGNYGISWGDPEHVAHARAIQDVGRAYVEAFWELADVAADYPPFILQLAEALHGVAAAVRGQHPGPDREKLRAEIRDALAERAAATAEIEGLLARSPGQGPAVPVFGQRVPAVEDNPFAEAARASVEAENAWMAEGLRQAWQETLPGLEKETQDDRTAQPGAAQPAGEAAAQGEPGPVAAAA